MPVDDYPEDDNESIRQSYNFAPGYHGLVYRADTPDTGAGRQHHNNENEGEPTEQESSGKGDATEESTHDVDGASTQTTKYKLQAMKWGLIPFWTKRSPDYGSMMRTINCRDDSLSTSGGMWNTMKQRKRCIVVCEGFYEWLKKNNGKEKIPHFVKRKDGQLMCFAGLWDCVKYEDQEEKLYTYTIITTDSNKQLKFLHDRMPVIFDQGSEAVRTWLDPGRAEWSRDLQSLLKPYDGELECYPVDRAVGKVGNNSPSFVVPIDSKENKKNIANFFGKQKEQAKGVAEKKAAVKEEKEVKEEGGKIDTDANEKRETDVKLEGTEDNAPLPKPEEESEEHLAKAVKRKRPDEEDTIGSPEHKAIKTEGNPAHETKVATPEKAPKTTRKTRSATSNGSAAKTPKKAADGSQRITNFFGK